jgi:predicted nucleic acid-binding Zn ribbon protein
MEPERIDRLFGQIVSKPTWAPLIRWQTVCELWQQVLPANYRQRVRVNILRENILYVNVATSAIAHELTFQRQELLHRLNQHLDEPLGDLRFAVGTLATKESSATMPDKDDTPLSPPTDCPTCYLPTPASELSRWGICRFCQIERWKF